MTMTISWISILFNYVTLSIAIVLFVTGTAALAVSWKRLSIPVRAVLIAALIVILLYLTLVMWAVVGWGSAPSHDPAPVFPYSQSTGQN